MVLKIFMFYAMLLNIIILCKIKIIHSKSTLVHPLNATIGLFAIKSIPLPSVALIQYTILQANLLVRFHPRRSISFRAPHFLRQHKQESIQKDHFKKQKQSLKSHISILGTSYFIVNSNNRCQKVLASTFPI